MNQYSPADLILNPDGSVYHLNILPEDLADLVITVGDPDRVAVVSRYFDKIEVKKGKREFITHTGYLGKKRITVLSTGIGTDNIEIVMNELDALANTDLRSRTSKQVKRALKIIRIGTAGSLNPPAALNALFLSTAAVGAESTLSYYHYNETPENYNLSRALADTFKGLGFNLPVFAASAAPELLNAFEPDIKRGLTYTASGFYAPQGRTINDSSRSGIIEALRHFSFGDKKICNIEMETAAIYAFSQLFGFEAVSASVIVADRANQCFSSNPERALTAGLEKVLAAAAKA